MLDMDIVNAAMVRQRSPEEAAAAAAAKAANAKKTELNQEDFLTLMITQLKHQDPFKPMDPSQYVGQLAQFSSVAGLSDINKNITALTSSLRGNQVLDGAALIGRTVIAEGNQVFRYVPEEGEAIPTQGAIEVPTGASSVQLVVRDSAGTLVKTQALDTRCRSARLQLGRQHRRRRHRAHRRLQDRSHRQRRRQEHFPRRPASRPRSRASRSTRPPARSRSTPTPSAKSP